ncbi:hypothetical protein J4Q44_G00026880 [Coregonus suidteri]|uniref:Dynein heavy chain linker domain-containing protein n=1 Tax=Coregonus suidteri TaxID=861788 RepID=A0AAN8MA32_9TELE
MQCSVEDWTMAKWREINVDAELRRSVLVPSVTLVSGLQGRLTVADSVLLVWLEVQRTWAHLESIFIGSEDVSHHLPHDALRFQDIDTDFPVLP